MIDFTKNPPMSWGDAVRATCGNLTDKEMNSLKELGSAMFHHSVGRQMRNDWGLWDPASKLWKSFNKEFGLTHADDMSGILLRSAEALAKGEDMEFHKWAEEYLDYWKLMKV